MTSSPTGNRDSPPEARRHAGAHDVCPAPKQQGLSTPSRRQQRCPHPPRVRGLLGATPGTLSTMSTPQQTTQPEAQRPESSDSSSVLPDVVSYATLRERGLSRSTIARRCRPDGPWQRLFPGVVLLTDSDPTREQLLRGVHCKFGSETVITGVDALHAHGITARQPGVVRLLVPAECRTALPELIVSERTSRRPQPCWHRGLPFAPPARAAIDAARAESERHRIRMLLRAPLYFGACTVEQLWSALTNCGQHSTAVLRRELRQLGTGEHIADFGTALRILRHGSIPQPRWHATLTDHDGRDLGSVDAWWDGPAVAWRFHDTPHPGVEPNHVTTTGSGVILVRSSPARLHEHPARVRTDIATAIRWGASRPRPTVTWRSTITSPGPDTTRSWWHPPSTT